jgi:hypothetical protein
MKREIAAFVCSHIFKNTHPLLLVARENGDWMFLCGQVHDDRHHHQDGTTMQLVPTDIHRPTGHTGGFRKK